MALSNVRFNLVDPAADAASWSARYQAMLEMASYADTNGFFGISVEEHHGSPDGWSPTPLLNAGMILARTTNVRVTISALLLPLHDPVRIAEDIAVLDLAAPGRLIVVVGLGYRPSEYTLHDRDWGRRGRIMDESIAVLLSSWRGEPFEHLGETVVVTPVPVSRPHPMLLVGGTSPAAARRAARFGLPMFLSANMPELEAYYHEQCTEHGTQGYVIMPPTDQELILVVDDPDRAWATLGQYFLHEATTYAGWQRPEGQSAVHSHAQGVEALRAEGIYKMLTPDECVARANEQGDAAIFSHHPMCGGMPIDEAWRSLQLFVDQVLPSI